MPTNDERAVWAGECARVYADLTGLDYDAEIDVAIGDLMASLLHLADRQGLCPETLIQRAQMHHAAEVEIEEDSDAVS